MVFKTQLRSCSPFLLCWFVSIVYFGRRHWKKLNCVRNDILSVGAFAGNPHPAFCARLKSECAQRTKQSIVLRNLLLVNADGCFSVRMMNCDGRVR